eukprot:TRINITY_DN94_c2_g1_i1.p5 TRINITY_DN94_c2_g1~~TRINITY_DN94_c2_g1_i1.p5  ORF type:complete len:130 (+),score=25.01 TRINITY_DN94_c2_g1_i1:58-447(+)
MHGLLIMLIAALIALCGAMESVVLEHALPHGKSTPASDFVLQTSCTADADCSGGSCTLDEVPMHTCVRGHRRASYRVTGCDHSGVRVDVFPASASCEGTPVPQTHPANQCYRASGSPFAGRYVQTLCGA